jgi:succinate dehydrogenase flavin-adding protein (antitoxin of CptAB toxin-antitoxin module)
MKIISQNPLIFGITRDEFEKMLNMNEEEILEWILNGGEDDGKMP